MFLYREVAALLRLRPTLRTQLTLLYGGLLAALGGSLVFLLVPLQGSASVQAGPHAAAISAAACGPALTDADPCSGTRRNSRPPPKAASSPA